MTAGKTVERPGETGGLPGEYGISNLINFLTRLCDFSCLRVVETPF